MVRASAKNHQHVLIATNPSTYERILQALQVADDISSVPMDLRRSLALEAFEHTASYDVAMPRNCTVALSGTLPTALPWTSSVTDYLRVCLLPAIK